MRSLYTDDNKPYDDYSALIYLTPIFLKYRKIIA